MEQSNTDRIHLHKERLFWIAYEKSAYLFSTHIKPYRAQKKYIKKLGLEMASLGFPDSALRAITAPIIEKTEKLIVLQSPERVVEKDFEIWKKGAPLYIKQPKFAPAPDRRTEFADKLVDRLRDFNVENKTPMECMMFVSELKTTLEYAI